MTSFSSFLCLCTGLSSQSSVGGHLGWFCFLAIVTRVAINMDVQSLCGVLTLGSADMFSEVVQLGYIVVLPVVSLGSPVLMLAVAVGAYILTSDDV